MIDVSSEAVAATMGFSDFGKKARQFDLDELVEETRKSAIDKNRENIGKIGFLIEVVRFSFFTQTGMSCRGNKCTSKQAESRDVFRDLNIA